MNVIQARLISLTNKLLAHGDPSNESYVRLTENIALMRELSATWRLYEACDITFPDNSLKERLDEATTYCCSLRDATSDEMNASLTELKGLQSVIRMWKSFGDVDITLDKDLMSREEDRRSSKTWDTGALTTDITLTAKQREAMELLDDPICDKVLLLGGSGSGKSFVEVYKIIRDTLRYKAPCLIARDKLIDLTQGVIDQIVPTILTLIAKANGQERYDTWTIDGLKFVKWSDKRSRMEFATGGYIRFAGLSIRDLSESGSDKILSPSWLHVMLEEVSELDYGIVEKVITRLRHNVPNVVNKLLLCENPPSINHWSYRRFYEGKRSDGSIIDNLERSQQAYLLMNPKDNAENLGENYIRNLSQMTGNNRKRFYDGAFQDSETGEIFKYMDWTDNMPSASDWDELIVYCDPTPLTTKEHSVFADYKASVLVGIWLGNTFVLDVRLVRGSTTDMLHAIKELWDLTPDPGITSIWMEKKGLPSDFKLAWGSFQINMNWYIPIQMDTRNFGEKKAAIETFLQPEFENETIHFNNAIRNTERGRQVEFQVLKFSRKKNVNVHDDIPDALMRAITKLKGKKRKQRGGKRKRVAFVRPAYLRIGG